MLGPGMSKVVLSTGSASIAVASTATVYTKAWRTYGGEYFALSWIGSSVIGTPAVKLEYEMSMVEPTTEGSADTTNYAVPDGASDIDASYAKETVAVGSVSPPALPWMRLKITGAGGNPADTIMTIYRSEAGPY